jgi:hypothetical protein
VTRQGRVRRGSVPSRWATSVLKERMSRLRFLYLLTFVILLLTSGIHAQTQASCKFTLFPLSVNVPNVGSVFVVPAGVNDYGTVVGAASLPSAINVAFVRWANGGVTLPLGTNESSLVDRNDHGTSLGYIGPESGQTPILLNGTTVTDIQLAVPNVFFVNSINNWGSVVGTYVGLDFAKHGFKRWSNGGFITLDYPGALETHPQSINDSGPVVGLYLTGGQQGNGFIYRSGQWATLNFPNSTSTSLIGISNAGMIVGSATVNGAATTFLYENGAFKVILVPVTVPIVTGISPKLGIIVGESFSTNQGFTGTCQQHFGRDARLAFGK